MFGFKREKRKRAIKRIRAKAGRKIGYEALVFCSSRNVHVQIIDRNSKKTKFEISTCKKGEKKNHKNVFLAGNLGRELASRCVQENLRVSDVSFNGAEKIFHGVVKAVADGFYQN